MQSWKSREFIALTYELAEVQSAIEDAQGGRKNKLEARSEGSIMTERLSGW